MVFHQQLKEIMVVTAVRVDKLVVEAVDLVVVVLTAHLLVVLVKVMVVIQPLVYQVQLLQVVEEAVRTELLEVMVVPQTQRLIL